jgi:ferredoxin--NADP+ reductase
VRKSTYIDPLTNHEDHSKKGICSSFLCDAKVGDLVHLTGPTGKTMLLSETPPTTDIILVATGTGVAPFRSFLRRLFVEDTPAARDFQSFAWLFLGAANQDSLLYADEWQRLTKEFPDRFRWTYALSREERNAIGGKMYIQDKLEFHANEIFARMERGAHLYFCGLRGMMPGIMATLERAAVMKGQVWSDVLKQWKEQGKWHVEVY